MKIPDGLSVEGGPGHWGGPEALGCPVVEGALWYKAGSSHMGTEATFCVDRYRFRTDRLRSPGLRLSARRRSYYTADTCDRSSSVVTQTGTHTW